jgi:hypothetical protein
MTETDKRGSRVLFCPTSKIDKDVDQFIYIRIPILSLGEFTTEDGALKQTHAKHSWISERYNLAGALMGRERKAC